MSILHLRQPLGWRCASMILLHLLVQQQEISFLPPCLTAAMWLITQKVPPSSPSCKDFSRVLPWCLNSVPPFLWSSFAWIVCGKLAWLHSIHGVATAFHPGSSNCIIAYNFCTVITCQNVNIPGFLYFYPQAFCHTLHEITKYTFIFNHHETYLPHLHCRICTQLQLFPCTKCIEHKLSCIAEARIFLCNQHD